MSIDSDTRYRTAAAPVRGGDLAVGVWGPDDAPTVIAVHGITASHRAWALLGQLAPDLRVIAPDLRGRGRSNHLPGPFGMDSHADDIAAVLDAFGVDRCLVIGHSMGGFVAVTLAERHPERVAGLVLVDGGLPLPLPAGVTPEDLPEALIGPAARRLAMRFKNAADYRDFWRVHPAFADDWSPTVEQYVDYDLVGTAPRLAPSAVAEAVAEDSLQLAGDEGYERALATIGVPIRFVRAPLDLADQAPGLYPEAAVEHWGDRVPQLSAHAAVDVNHYTIVMAERGMRQVLRVLRPAVEAAADGTTGGAITVSSPQAPTLATTAPPTKESPE